MNYLNYILIPILLINILLSDQKKVVDKKLTPKKDQARMVKKIKMIEHLDLDESQSEKLFTREKDLNKQLETITIKKRELRKRMGDVRIKKNATQGEVDILIDEMDKLDKEIKKLKKKHQKGVSDILTPNQRLKYVNFDNHFKTEMKEKIKKGKKPKKRRRSPK